MVVIYLDDSTARREGRQITVTNIDKNITEKDLWDTFDMFGSIERLKLARSKETGESQGKGFIAVINLSCTWPISFTTISMTFYVAVQTSN